MLVSIDIPDFVDVTENDIKQSVVLELYKQGKISSGVASKILCISRIEFLNLLGKHKITIGPTNLGEIKEEVDILSKFTND